MNVKGNGKIPEVKVGSLNGKEVLTLRARPIQLLSPVTSVGALLRSGELFTRCQDSSIRGQLS